MTVYFGLQPELPEDLHTSSPGSVSIPALQAKEETIGALRVMPCKVSKLVKELPRDNCTLSSSAAVPTLLTSQANTTRAVGCICGYLYLQIEHDRRQDELRLSTANRSLKSSTSGRNVPFRNMLQNSLAASGEGRHTARCIVT